MESIGIFNSCQSDNSGVKLFSARAMLMLLRVHSRCRRRVQGRARGEPQARQNDPLSFKTRVREPTKQSVQVKNGSSNLWRITPILSDDMWQGDETFEVPAGQTASYEVSYCPMVMTKPAAEGVEASRLELRQHDAERPQVVRHVRHVRAHRVLLHQPRHLWRAIRRRRRPHRRQICASTAQTHA